MIEVNSSSIKDIFSKNSGYVVILFVASWYGPCRLMQEILNKIAKENKSISENCRFFLIDIDKEKEIANNFMVKKIPALYILKNGEIVNTSSEIMSEAKINEFIEKNLQKSNKQI